MKILFIKTGAMGDVIRNSYALKYLKQKYGRDSIIDFITSVNSIEILRYNYYIDNIYFSENLKNFDFEKKYDLVISLEENFKIKNQIPERIIGVDYLNENNNYSSDSAYWFDMSLISKYGKNKADELKKNNLLSYNSILENMLDIKIYEPTYFYCEKKTIYDKNSIVGLNLFAGERWSSKSLSFKTNYEIVDNLLNLYPDYFYILLTGKDNYDKAKILSESINNKKLILLEPCSIDYISSYIKNMKLLITTDSLCMHIGISVKTPILSYFTCTSANEIELFNNGEKIVLDSHEYCSYKSEIDTSNMKWESFYKSIKINNLL